MPHKRSASGAQPPKRVRGEAECPECGKIIKGAHLLNRHLETHQASPNCCYDCPFCNYMGCHDINYMKTHIHQKHQLAFDAATNLWQCRKCGWWLTEAGMFDQDHVDQCLKVTRDSEAGTVALEPPPDNGNNVLEYQPDQLDPPGDNHPVWRDIALEGWFQEYEDLRDEVRRLWYLIRQRFQTSSEASHIYTFRVAGDDHVTINCGNFLHFIYTQEKYAFSFNISSTYVLVKEPEDDDSTQEYQFRIWTAQNNKFFLDRNLVVHDLATLTKAVEDIEDIDAQWLIDHMEYPNTKWRYAGLLDIVFYVFNRPTFLCGRGKSHLPDYITQNKGINALERDKNGNYYQDNLCFFRCLVDFWGQDPDDMEAVITAYERYARHINGPYWWDFAGLPDIHYSIVENLFNINLKIIKFHSRHQKEIIRKPMNPNRPTLIVGRHD